MAFVHGKDSHFTLTTDAGADQNLSTYITDVSFPETIETVDVTTLSKSSKEYLVGLRDATISISGKWDATIDQGVDGKLGNSTAIAFQYGPAGNTGGTVKYSGNAFITNYSVTGGIGDAVNFSLDLQVTGGVTRGTW